MRRFLISLITALMAAVAIGAQPASAIVVVEPPAEACYADETAWGTGTRYLERGNWATYTAFAKGRVVNLMAGQDHLAGKITFGTPDADGKVTITIKLLAGFRFASDSDAVKVEGYATAPDGMKPVPGQFTYKDATINGNTATIVVDVAKFYGIHVDVERVVACPEL